MMQVALAAVLLVLLSAGCATSDPDPPISQPQTVETQPATPQPAADPAPTTAARPQPAPAAPAPSGATTPQPAGKPSAPGSTTAAVPQPSPAAPAPRGTTTPPRAPGKPATPAPRPPVAQGPTPAAPPVVAPPSPTAPVPLDVKTLTEQLKATKAIGVFTKLSLKNKVDDLLQQFREHHEGKPKPTTAELRQGYNLLMMKVLSLLQDEDQKLASQIVASREAIWSLLANPKTFATLQT